MVLIPPALAADLYEGWLGGDGGNYPASVVESGDRFAHAVSGWFSAATAGAFPCATASARRPQLAGSAAMALQAGAPPLAGQQLAVAVVGYMTGQVFGAGIASPPAAAAAAQAAFAAVFANPDLETDDRATLIATGVYTLAVSTLVVFPPVVSPPLPVL